MGDENGIHENSSNMSSLQKAFLVIKNLEKKLQEKESYSSNEEIAIVGIACHLPGHINDKNDFWQALVDERSLITKNGLSKRWRKPVDDNVVSHAGLLDDIAGFDNDFFHISPGEARYIDPQHRHLLMVAYKAFEDAAIPTDNLYNSNTGVFVGIGAIDYSLHITSQNKDLASSPYLGSGNSLSGGSGRLAYHFGFKGPCISIDTACSSSLVAVHQACNSLRNNECDAALVGGVNFLLSAELQKSLTDAGMLSTDGLCKTFNNNADGYVRSEGCIAVVLKRLQDAERDGDRIYACIKGSAVMQDGASGGLTVPDPKAQSAVINKAMEAAKVNVDDISFIEAHGTGTSLGDPVEMQGLSLVFGKEQKRNLHIGSVKTNVGHLEAAAGLAGLLKASLSVYHKQLPGHLHYDTPSEYIDWRKSPVKVNGGLHQLANSKRIIGGVSSFGFTGTISHCVIAEYVRSEEQKGLDQKNKEHTLIISAPDTEGLERLRKDYVDYLQVTSDSLQDICHTASEGRNQYYYMLAVSGSSKQELTNALKTAKHISNAGNSKDIIERTSGNIVDLPLYPFLREQFWIGELPGNINSQPTYNIQWRKINEIKENDSNNIFLVPKQSSNAFFIQSLTRDVKTELIEFDDYSRIGDTISSLRKRSSEQIHLVYDITSVKGESYQNSYNEAISLLKILSAITAPPDSLLILTEGAMPVNKDDISTNALQYSLATFFKSAGLEIPEVPVQVIDIKEGLSLAETPDNILSVINDEQYQEVCVNEQGVYYPVLELSDSIGEDISVDTSGAYLITGGNGTLGQHLLQWLSDNGANTIIITGRSKGDGRYDDIANVVYKQLDVADEKAMVDFTGWLQTENILLKGVVHAAGISHQRRVEELSIEDIDKAFSSKVTGLNNLVNHLPLNSLDSFTVYSSIASVWGSAMLSHYAAANGYMDAVVRNLRASGVPAKTINWGPWAASNMMLQDESSTELLESSGVMAHNADDVLASYASLMSPSSPQTIYVELNAEKFVPLMELRRPSAFWNEIRAGSERDEAGNNNCVKQKTEITSVSDISVIVENELKAILGMDNAKSISRTKNFNEMGMDSILLMKYVNNLKEQLNIPVTTNMIFNYPTLEQLTKHITDYFIKEESLAENRKQSDDTYVSLTDRIESMDDDELLELIQEDLKKMADKDGVS